MKPLQTLNNETINEYLAEPIFHPKFTTALTHISRAYASFGRNPACCYITGPSGVGKTMLAKTAEQIILNKIELNSDSNVNAEIIPVVRVTLQDGALPDDVRRDILDALNVDALSHSRRNLRILLEKQLKVCGVKLIIFDEFQHLVRKFDKDVNRNACNFIKNLIDTTGIPVVLLGTPTGKKLFELYDELRTRFICAGELEQMSCEDLKSSETFRRYLSDLMQRFPLKSIDLSSENNLLRVMLATGGNLRALEFLLSEALAAHSNRANELKLNDYQEVYNFTRRQELISNRGRVIRPFSDSIESVRNDLKNLEKLEFSNV